MMDQLKEEIDDAADRGAMRIDAAEQSMRERFGMSPLIASALDAVAALGFGAFAWWLWPPSSTVGYVAVAIGVFFVLSSLASVGSRVRRDVLGGGQ